MFSKIQHVRDTTIHYKSLKRFATLRDIRILQKIIKHFISIHKKTRLKACFFV
jgi:hypothetical protein